MGEGRGDAHIRRVYPPGSSNSPARHSPSASWAPAAGLSLGRHAGPDPHVGPPRIIGRCTDGGGEPSRTPLSGARAPEECMRLHRVGKGGGAGGRGRWEGATHSGVLRRYMGNSGGF